MEQQTYGEAPPLQHGEPRQFQTVDEDELFHSIPASIDPEKTDSDKKTTDSERSSTPTPANKSSTSSSDNNDQGPAPQGGATALPDLPLQQAAQYEYYDSDTEVKTPDGYGKDFAAPQANIMDNKYVWDQKGCSLPEGDDSIRFPQPYGDSTNRTPIIFEGQSTGILPSPLFDLPLSPL